MSGMHLLPVYYTTLNTRKRKKGKKSKSLLEAERKHAKYLKRIMGKSGDANGTIGVSEYQGESHPPAEGSIPSLPPTSCYICKIGWLDDEPTPVLRNHEGLYYCENCYAVIQRRIAANE